MMRSMVRGIDERLGTARATRVILNKVFPDHWSFLLGEVALYCFVILLATGVYLTLFFDASLQEVLYAGSYVPLQGVEMSRAYASALDISFSVRAGLVVRQVHHWAALLFGAAMVTHLLRTFFTAAFRKPREMNWVIGLTILALSMLAGFTGYSMIDDQLSGTGLRIGYSILVSVPVVGTWMSSLLLGGEFPGADILSRLFVLHIMIFPAIIAVLLGVHMVILIRQKHTQWPGKGRREDNVVGFRLWPMYAMKAIGVFFLTSAVVSFMGGFVQINPIWLFGPFRVADVSSASQPDWYVGWLEGALRLMPAWELRAAPFEIPNPFYPALILAGTVFIVLYAWPWMEARFVGDHDMHNLLERPSQHPTRTSAGIAALVFLVILLLAGGDDVFAVWFDMSVNTIVRMLQALVIVLPIATFFISRAVMRRRLRKAEESGHYPQSPRGHSTWELAVGGAWLAAAIGFIVLALANPSPPALPATWNAEHNAGMSSEQLYNAACAQCHGTDLAGDFGPAIGQGSDATQMSDSLIQSVVFSGIGRMPPMPGVLTEDQAAQVVGYIRAVQNGSTPTD